MLKDVTENGTTVRSLQYSMAIGKKRSGLFGGAYRKTQDFAKLFSFAPRLW